MYKEYGEIYDINTNKNNAPMTTPYDMNNPFKALIDQIDKVRTYVLAGGQ